MKVGALLCLLLLCPNALHAQGTSQVTFTFSNPALQPPAFTIVLSEDGHGRYHSEPSGAGEVLDRDITVTDPLRHQLFTTARKNHLFATECETKHGNLAFTGSKSFAYKGPEGAGSCNFNYARDALMQTAASQLIAVASTLEQGRALELLLTHDKLGLDAAVERLTEEQADGRALDLENLQPVLQAIADNPEVLNRTRSRASALLTAAASAKQ